MNYIYSTALCEKISESASQQLFDSHMKPNLIVSTHSFSLPYTQGSGIMTSTTYRRCYSQSTPLTVFSSLLWYLGLLAVKHPVRPCIASEARREMWASSPRNFSLPPLHGSRTATICMADLRRKRSRRSSEVGVSHKRRSRRTQTPDPNSSHVLKLKSKVTEVTEPRCCFKLSQVQRKQTFEVSF